MMEQTTRKLTDALRPWLTEALTLMKERPDVMAEVRASMDGDASDVRVVFHVRANAISIECATYLSETIQVAEVFREQIVPTDGGFGLPETDTKQ